MRFTHPSRGIVLAAFIAYASPAVCQFAGPTHDVRAAINIARLNEAIGVLRGARYEADVRSTTHGICSSGLGQIELEQGPTLRTLGWLDPFNGRSGLNLDTDFVVRGRLVNCLPLGDFNVGIPCQIRGSFGAITESKLAVGGLCTGLGLFQEAPLLMTFPTPSVPTTGLVVQLTDPPATPQQDIHLEFGERRGGIWVSTGKAKMIPLSLIASGPLAVPYGLALDLSVSPLPPRQKASTKEEAERLFAEDQIFDEAWKDLAVGISISESLFGSTEVGGNKAGLLNHLLPIRVFGKVSAGGERISFEIFLDGAYVKFEQNTIAVSFATSSARVWDRGVEVGVGPGHLVESTRAVAKLSEPKINPTGAITTTITSLTLALETCLGNTSCKLDPTDLQNTINDAAIQIGQLTEKFQVAIPDCIEVPPVSGLVVTSKRQCRDGARANRFGLVTGVSQVEGVIDPSKARIRLKGRYMQIGVPAIFSQK